MATATAEPVRLPPGPRVPKILQGVAFLAAREEVVAVLARRYGGAVTVNLPILRRTLVIGDPSLVKNLLSAGIDVLGRATHTFGAILGPGSTWGLDGGELLERRRLLAPPFHGKRMRSYDHIIEEEVMREVANWPEGREFETLPSMLRITLNAILRAVFGAEGPALDELRELIPPAVKIASRIALLPPIVWRDFGPWSPGGRALLLRARSQDGQPIPDRHIVNELLTLLAAGHETTSASLAWAVERLRRHPSLLSRLTAEVEAGGSELRQATIWEVQRSRPVLEATLRRTKKQIRLGDWVIPRDTTVLISMQLANEQSFTDAASFDPNRFVGANSTPATWFPFGGGLNRCIGAAFANMEMDVTLRTLLREFRFAPTHAPGERRHNRGVMIAPGRGGRAMVYRRTANASSDEPRLSAVDDLRRNAFATRNFGEMNAAPASANNVLDALSDSAESVS